MFVDVIVFGVPEGCHCASRKDSQWITQWETLSQRTVGDVSIQRIQKMIGSRKTNLNKGTESRDEKEITWEDILAWTLKKL